MDTSRTLAPMRRGAWETLRDVALTSEGNSVDLLWDGDRAFRAMWRAIRAARRRVWLETFILEPDPVGLHTLALLRGHVAQHRRADGVHGGVPGERCSLRSGAKFRDRKAVTPGTF